MKKFKLEENAVLQRSDLKNVIGGYVSECKIFIRMVEQDASGAWVETGNNFWSDKDHSVESAQNLYDGGSGDVWAQGFGYTGYAKITGYCCASC